LICFVFMCDIYRNYFSMLVIVEVKIVCLMMPSRLPLKLNYNINAHQATGNGTEGGYSM
jgi:hypothetical protein